MKRLCNWTDIQQHSHSWFSAHKARFGWNWYGRLRRIWVAVLQQTWRFNLRDRCIEAQVSGDISRVSIQGHYMHAICCCIAVARLNTLCFGPAEVGIAGHRQRKTCHMSLECRKLTHKILQYNSSTSSKRIWGMAGLAWLVLAALVQLLWGVYPAALRFLQTQIPHALTSLQLSFLINACACPALLVHSTVLALSDRIRRWRAASESVVGQNAIARNDPVKRAANSRREKVSSVPPLDSPTRPLLGQPEPEEGRSGAGNSSSEPSPDAGRLNRSHTKLFLTERWATCCRKMGFLTATTAALTALMISQIFALHFVEAYISQMVFLLAPLIVSTLALATLHSPLPPKFWPTLLLMLLGSALVVGGKALAQAQGGGSAAAAAGPLQIIAQPPGTTWAALRTGGELTARHVAPGLPGWSTAWLRWREAGFLNWGDVAGVALSLLSALSLAAFMLIVQVAGSAVSEAELLWANFPTQALLSLGLTWGLERSKFSVLGELHPWEWAVVVSVAVAVNWLSNWLQQVTIKQLGAPQVAAFLPLRLVGSLAASYAILAEKLDNVWEGAGAAVVMLTLTGYLAIQKRHADVAARAAVVMSDRQPAAAASNVCEPESSNAGTGGGV